jgi:hypothetical protein
MGKKSAAAAAMANAYLCIENSPYVELIVLALHFAQKFVGWDGAPSDCPGRAHHSTDLFDDLHYAVGPRID